MRHGKTTALKCLPLATELLIVFLTADILWQLLCGRPPFSMWGFLLSLKVRFFQSFTSPNALVRS